MSTGFQEFLKRKVEGSGWKDRSRGREEWLDALKRLFVQIRAWLSESDPDHLIEIVPYEVQRVEKSLGIYDAPALKIRLGTDSIDILPMGRHTSKPYSIQELEGKTGGKREWGDLGGGRVDITDGERRYLLLRAVGSDQDSWLAYGDQGRSERFDRDCLEMILQDLLK